MALSLRRWRAFVCALALVGACLGSTAQAQEARLYGTVRDAATDEPLPLANVVVEGRQAGGATDRVGAYELRRLPAGPLTLVVSYLGYEPRSVDLTLAPGEARRLDVRLRPREIGGREVVVTADEAEAQDLGVARLEAAEIQELPTVLEPDVFRSLQLLPGIQAASDFSSGLYIRGGSPDQTLVLLDRTPVYNPSHVFGFFSTFNPDAIDDVQVYKGGYPVEYGGRLGSVVALDSRRGGEAVEARVGVGLLASRASVSGPHPRGRWLVAIRRSTLEPLLAGLNAAEVDGVPEQFYFYDVNATTTADLSARDRLDVSLYAGRDQLLFPFLDVARFDVGYGNQALSAGWTHRPSDRLFTRLTATVARYLSDPRGEFVGTEFRQANDLLDAGLRGEVGWQAADRHTLAAGFKTGRFRFQLSRSFDGVEQFSPRLATTYAEAYVQDTYRATDRLELEGGVRLGYYSNGRFVRLNPRLSADYRVDESVRLQVGYGRYAQNLGLVTSEFFSAFDVWLTTGDEVPPAYGDQFVAGVKARLPGAVQVDLETYYRTMRALFEFNPLLPDVTGLDYADALRFGEGYAYGTELLVRRRTGRLNGFLSYAYSKTERRYRGFEQFRYYPPKYDRRHSLNLALNYDLSMAWRLTSVFSYGSGQAYTEPRFYYRLQDLPFTSAPVTSYGSAFNGARTPPYHRLDVGVRRQGRFFGIADYELLLQVVNAYGRRNLWFYLFEPQDDGSIERSAVPQIPVPLPNVAFTLTF